MEKEIIAKRKLNACIVALFLSNLVVLAFSAVGYIQTEHISISFLPVLVLLTAYVYGWKGGLAAGTMFGLLSMWRAAVSVGEMDALFSPVRSGAVVKSLVLSVVTRMIFGLVAGLLFEFTRKRKINNYISCGLISFLSMAIHTFVVFLAMNLLFPDVIEESKVSAIILDGRRLLEYVAAVGILMIAHRIGRSTELRKIVNRLEEQITVSIIKLPLFRVLVAAMGLYLMFSITITMYRNNQTERILGSLGTRLKVLSMQILVARISLFVSIGIVLSLVCYYAMSVEENAKREEMTKAYRRNAFIDFVTKELGQKRSEEESVLIMSDVDFFKSINDTYGHAVGDRVLIEVSDILQRHFNDIGYVGRMGGDEFAVFCQCKGAEQIAQKRIQEVIDELHQISLPDDRIRQVHSSYGMAVHRKLTDFEELYKEADEQLYACKRQRRQ